MKTGAIVAGANVVSPSRYAISELHASPLCLGHLVYVYIGSQGHRNIHQWGYMQWSFHFPKFLMINTLSTVYFGCSSRYIVQHFYHLFYLFQSFDHNMKSVHNCALLFHETFYANITKRDVQPLSCLSQTNNCDMKIIRNLYLTMRLVQS